MSFSDAHELSDPTYRENGESGAAKRQQALEY